ncbi:indolepyruvate ferredoxin oxidoreductase subunit alpha [Sporomusa acidovorans]|uniref:Indolepyruvate oxidoreductase subunit IorA n=1 Tax=Sporomusa acidovorans (strain ATCC 49682 / DSM 3132 / Mol) TaxID=1123286 RepID=A0ABZ3J4N2_SPOA4|nr:indolepyruvate ferredoxin oxidoreductase subunit alpha [Sporomusa acidovorans]OZC23096.1 electron transport complex subunit RsxB [Sporomusa acidovorans DSM 3132]SDF05331.1 indolepyruvate ferredoxin oxidoreductase alpha subunit [Sporomusa acidovorans]
MKTKLLMGNEAIALGAIRAGVNVVCGYPGTPSTEVLETVAKHRGGDIYVEWSVNEKVALEVAAGAAYTGARALVTMKQVGLNVASDPLMSLAYIGVQGGMVVLVADDPGPISSQTEQDTRHFAQYAHLPIFDPATPEEAYTMMGEAFALSEKYNTPVLFRPTTQVCHACASVEIDDERYINKIDGFIKDPKWVIFPRLSYQNHIKLAANEARISQDFSAFPYNQISGQGNLGIIGCGVSFTYVTEAMLSVTVPVKILKLATPHPFPEELVTEFLQGLEEVLVVEELDPVVEENLLRLCGNLGITLRVKGKLTKNLPVAGKYSYEIVAAAIRVFVGQEQISPAATTELPPLPVRPPVLCAGCPHRASFYSVKQAMKKSGHKAVFTGDIGCYTLGNAQPLDMVDTCLCMGAGITIAQGLQLAEPDRKQIAFIGDSTFFHTGIAGIINAVYNETDITVIILDNSTTAMTGHQPHPGTGKTMMGTISEKISIENVLKGCGVKFVAKANPLNLFKAVETVNAAVNHQGVSAVIFESPCIAMIKPAAVQQVKDTCIGCRKCIKEIGCPAMSIVTDKVAINPHFCYGCRLCSQVCPVQAIGGVE